MPTCWTKNGDEYTKKCYIDDDPPDDVVEVDKMLSGVIQQAAKMGVTIMVMMGDTPYELKSFSRKYKFKPQTSDGVEQ